MNVDQYSAADEDPVPARASGSGPARAIAPRSHKRAIVVVIIVVVVLLLLGWGAVYVVPKYLNPPSTPGHATSPTDAVQAYLDALSHGDATTALSYSTAQPSDSTFANDQFLAAAISANPLTDIQVPAGQSTTSPAQIQATYTLADHQVQAHFTVQKYGRDWRLDWGFLPLDLSNLTAKSVPITINGVGVGVASMVYLFPGTYTFASLNPMLALNAPTFTIDYPEANPSLSEGFVLSDDAVARIQAAAKDHLDQCLTQKVLLPDGCGFGFSGTRVGTLDPNTIHWSLSDNTGDITTIQPTLDGSSLTVAVASITIQVRFYAVSTDKVTLYQDTASISAVRADFSNPDQIAVTFG
ncbi:MAG: hypothetical protein FWF43_05965 [Propionibacteriaceae bacterium]|nr:hypothetical protein [Propionibacteriaceae bacterium]